MRLLFIWAPRSPITRGDPRFKPCAFPLASREERSVAKPLRVSLDCSSLENVPINPAGLEWAFSGRGACIRPPHSQPGAGRWRGSPGPARGESGLPVVCRVQSFPSCFINSAISPSLQIFPGLAHSSSFKERKHPHQGKKVKMDAVKDPCSCCAFWGLD